MWGMQGGAYDMCPVLHAHTCHACCLPAVLHPGRQEQVQVKAARGRALQAGLNMSRLWGGAAVARAAFYDACDEAGILVRARARRGCPRLHACMLCTLQRLPRLLRLQVCTDCLPGRQCVKA